MWRFVQQNRNYYLNTFIYTYLEPIFMVGTEHLFPAVNVNLHYSSINTKKQDNG